MRVQIQPKEYTIPALTQAIVQYFVRKTRSSQPSPLPERGEGEEVKSSPIEVIFFDLGNVILPFNNYQIAEKLSRFLSEKRISGSRGRYSLISSILKTAPSMPSMRESYPHKNFFNP